VRDQLKVRSTSHYRGVKKYENNYSGLLFCGDCGSPMFSRSRPDLASAYICGTYHARGLAGCTTHHIRTDVLDDIVKSYMQRVCTECNDMLSVLNERLEQDASKVQVQTSVAEDLAVQIEQENETLKVLMRQKTRDVLRAGENASIVEATYDDLIKESTNKIKGLENQMLMVVDLRNTFVQAERFTRTVLDILRDIIEKPTLDRKDLCLLVERIVVHTDRVEILFKDDVYQLLQCASGETEENLASVAVQSAEKRKNRVLDVRVVSNGDPLEIYTDREGEVIFKKYSPIGELAVFAGEYAETLHKTCALSVVICDRDAVIATAGVPRKEYADKPLSDEMEKIIESRTLYAWHEGMDAVPVTAEGTHTVRCAMPILSEGDIVGCVVSLSNGEKEDKKAPTIDVETKLIQTAAGFLGRQLES
jgi:stage V sporulation protein T